MSKKSVRDLAINLRLKGYSYKYIKEQTSVSKSTLSVWLRDIQYKPNKETVERIGTARANAAITKNLNKIKKISDLKIASAKEIGKITKRDLFMLGIGLYLGEGSKTQGTVRIVSSDQNIILLAIRWFNLICDVPISNMRLAVHIYPDNSVDKCMRFWSSLTKIPLSQFGKTQIDQRNKVSKKKNYLPFGTAHLTMTSGKNPKLGVMLSRKIEFWSKEVFKRV